PLDAGEIRLLHLRKRSIFSGLINLELVPVVLLQAATYNFEAISYTWGSEPPSKAILLNGSSHAVTPNVHALLLARGSMFRDRFLWIDSMCINQADISEKTTQLRMMASVYETAHRVISWLGDHPA
ncbi:heterokaryon incompatibility protein-domain-containing protein, partial [Schizothecium vesticola]